MAEEAHDVIHGQIQGVGRGQIRESSRRYDLGACRWIFKGELAFHLLLAMEAEQIIDAPIGEDRPIVSTSRYGLVTITVRSVLRLQVEIAFVATKTG